MMNPNTHRLSGRHCPLCGLPLHQVIDRPQIEYCPNYITCEYEAATGIIPPLTKTEWLQKQIAEKTNNIEKLNVEISALEKEMAELYIQLDGGGVSG